jgi:hypothetical protein
MSVKRPKRKKLSKRVPAALVRWMKQQNPAMKKAAAVRIRKLKGGGVSITPVMANPSYKQIRGRYRRLVRIRDAYWKKAGRTGKQADWAKGNEADDAVREAQRQLKEHQRRNR